MFDFPKVNRDEYSNLKRNFLRAVIFQIKYSPISNISVFETEIKNAFISELPRIQNINDHGVQFSIGENQTPILQSKGESFVGFELRNDDGNKTLTITNDAITLQISGAIYKDYDSHKEFINKIIVFSKKINVIQLSRIAIRKINVIEFKNDKLKPMDGVSIILNPYLSELVKNIPSKSFLNNFQNTIRFKNGNDNLNLIYGFNVLNEDVSQVYIDMDLFKESQTFSYDLNNLSNEFTGLNNELFNIFHWSLGSELKSHLKNN